jgi:16S rRNA (cytosine967-C5)-methyltransferase
VHPPRVNPARLAAYRLLARLAPDAQTDPPPLAEVLDRARLSEADRRLLQALYLGVCRQRPRLDHALAGCISRPWPQVQEEVRNVLRLGAFQIFFLDRVPDRAAVDESVKLCRALRLAGATGFVNGVLRRLARERPAAPNLASTAGIALRTGMPEWLAERFAARHGEEGAEVRLAALNAEPSGLSVRVNTLRGDVPGFLAALAAAGVAAVRGPLGRECLVLAEVPAPRTLPGFTEGGFYVQDPASQWVTELLDPQPAERILDACAAPGGKCSHIAARLDNHGEVVALEHDHGRARRLRQNLERLGVKCVTVVEADAVTFIDPRPFDRILLDAPCTGLGVLRRHPEIRWRRTPADVVRAAERQLALLNHLSGLLRPGGTLVYATCSTEPEEGEEVVERFLAGADGYRLDTVPELLAGIAVQHPGLYRTEPHRLPVDGFFAARLRRE